MKNIETQAAIAAERARDRDTERFYDADYLPIPEVEQKPTTADRFYSDWRVFEEHAADALVESLQDEHVCKLWAYLQLIRDNAGNRDQAMLHEQLGQFVADNVGTYINRLSEAQA